MVSAQKPTSVTHSILGRITSERDLNLIICKSTLIEVYKVTSDGLVFIKQVGIWGVCENLNLIKLRNENKDSILITTAKYDIMVLSLEYNADGFCDVITKIHGNFKDSVPRNSSLNVITIVESSKSSSVIAIKCYDGILKIIPVTNGDNKALNISTIRMDDLNVIDMVFLPGHETPTIGILIKTPTNKLHFKAYELEGSNGFNVKDLSKLTWHKDITDNQAFIIPVPEPCGGVLLIGTQAIVYCNKNDLCLQKSPFFLKYGEINNYCMIDSNGQRFLLSNTIGNLYMMVLIYEKIGYEVKIADIKFEFLGETVIADNLTYIDNGVIFIGSKLGDSQLIKLVEQPNEHGNYVNTLETYTNLGPILDMLIVDVEKQGQGQLITCSGGHRNGSLRIIRNGIGIHESANVDLPGIKAMWAMQAFSIEYDDHIVLSFFGYTKIFSIIGEEFEDVELDGFDLASQTLHCSNAIHNQIIQVTTSSVRLIKRNTETNRTELVKEWKIPEGEFISVATCNRSECLVACRNHLNYFVIGNGDFEITTSQVLEHEIACLDLSPQRSNGGRAEFCAVGLWGDISARLLILPTLEQISYEKLKGDIIPRSILIESLEQINYLFVSLGDGSVISYIIRCSLENEKLSLELTESRKVVLGTQPTILKKFHSEKPVPTNNIFACSDRPSVISTTNQKLVYSSVNLKQVEYMCQLNAKDYPNSLALLSSGTLRIGTIDSIQKLHIRTVPLNETARRITYQADTQTFGIITFRMDLMSPDGTLKPITPSASTQCSNQHFSKRSALEPNNEINNLIKSEAGPSTSKSAQNNDFNGFKATAEASGQIDSFIVNSFLILDQNTFEVMQSVQFQVNEYAISILSMSFENDPGASYFVIGCCYVDEDEPEPKVGRIVVFRYTESKLVQVCEKDIKGAPYCLQSFNGKLLVTVSNSLKLFELVDNQLNQLATYSDNIFIIHLKCKNDFILIGDLTKSCAILTYRTDTNVFELVARDYSPIWLSSIEMIDDDNFLICDCFQNIITLKKDSGQSNEEDRKCLQNHGCIHLGEQINVFKHGSLGMEQQQNEILASHFNGSILGGTVNGSVILFVSISNQMFKILNELQLRLSKFVTTVGKIEYNNWRDSESDRRVMQNKYIIDGDLIESFLELNSNDADNLIKDFKIDNSTIGHSNEEFSLNYFNKLVEELSRLH